MEEDAKNGVRKAPPLRTKKKTVLGFSGIRATAGKAEPSEPIILSGDDLVEEPPKASSKRRERAYSQVIPSVDSSTIMTDDEPIRPSASETEWPLPMKMAGIVLAAAGLFFGLLFLGGAIR